MSLKQLSRYLLQFFVNKMAHEECLRLEDYHSLRFFFSMPGSGRNVFCVPLNDLITIPNLINRISPMDACFLGIILGELYCQHFEQNQPIHCPVNQLDGSSSEIVFVSYHDDSGHIEFANQLQNRRQIHILSLVKDYSLIKKFSSSHAYQIGFYAGELLHKIKSALHQTFTQCGNNIIPFPSKDNVNHAPSCHQ